MKLLKNLLPFVATLFIYIFAINSPMQKQMDQKTSIDNETNEIPIKEFKQN